MILSVFRIRWRWCVNKWLNMCIVGWQARLKMFCHGGGKLLHVYRERLHRIHDAPGPVEEVSNTFQKYVQRRNSVLFVPTSLYAMTIRWSHAKHEQNQWFSQIPHDFSLLHTLDVDDFECIPDKMTLVRQHVSGYVYSWVAGPSQNVLSRRWETITCLQGTPA